MTCRCRAFSYCGAAALLASHALPCSYTRGHNYTQPSIDPALECWTCVLQRFEFLLPVRRLANATPTPPVPDLSAHAHSTPLDSDLLLGGRRLLETGTECSRLGLGHGKQGAKLDVLGVGPVQLRLELLQ